MERKIIIIVLAFLMPLISLGQSPIGYRRSDTSLVVTEGGQRQLWKTWDYTLHALDTKASTVTDISSLQSYAGNSTTLIVKDTVRGGVFNKVLSGPADNGVIFQASNGAYWKRQYNSSDGVKVAWWGDNFQGILSAVKFSGKYGKIVLTPAKKYLQTDEIQPKYGQVFEGNYAILQRQPEAIVTLTAQANSTDSTIIVSSVPASWKVGNYLQIFQDSTAVYSSSRRKIASISGNTIKFTTQVGNPYYISDLFFISGLKVRKVFHQFTSPTPDDNQGSGINYTVTNGYEINKIKFDGNKNTVGCGDNVFWPVNSVIYNMGRFVKLDKCEFYDIPNDNLNGHGFIVNDAYAHRLNNSFYHSSANDTTSAYGGIKQYPSYFKNPLIDTVNIKPSATYSRHSEAVFTQSYSGGYYTVTGGRITNSQDAAFGRIQSGINIGDAGQKYINISGMVVRNTNGVFAPTNLDVSYPTQPGMVIVTNNIFDNCGTTTLPSDTHPGWAAGPGGFYISNNVLTGNTVLTTPYFFKDSKNYIVNQNNSAQPGNIRINGSITGSNITGTSLSVTGNASASSFIGITKANLYNSMGSDQTAAVQDFNDASNLKPGFNNMIIGSSTNGPGGPGGYYPFVMEYGGTKTGTGNLGEVLFPYGNQPAGNVIWTRSRFGGTWTAWRQLINDNDSQTLSNKTLASPIITGTLSAPSVSNATAANNSLVTLSNNGTVISRNIADSNAALTVNNANASSTGPIESWQSNGASVASLSKSGTFNTLSLNLNNLPATSGGGYDILTRNSSNGLIEKVSSTFYTTPAAVQSALSGGSTAPTIALGPASVVGTGATISITGNNIDGVITLTTGTGISGGGTAFTVTMGGSFSYPTSCTPILQSNTAAGTANVLLSISGQNGTSWSAYAGVSTGPTLTNSTTYKWNYHNGGY